MVPILADHRDYLVGWILPRKYQEGHTPSPFCK